MCKTIFNKNQNYTIKELGEALMQALPGKWADMHSCATNISRYIKEKGINPVNSQKSHRVFSGIDCQKVYEHYAPSMDKRQVKMKIEDLKPVKDKKPILMYHPEGQQITLSADLIKEGTFNFKNCPSEVLRKIKSEVDELLLNMGPDWEKLHPGDELKRYKAGNAPQVIEIRDNRASNPDNLFAPF